jgi:hypothetical protein
LLAGVELEDIAYKDTSAVLAIEMSWRARLPERSNVYARGFE